MGGEGEGDDADSSLAIEDSRSGESVASSNAMEARSDISELECKGSSDASLEIICGDSVSSDGDVCCSDGTGVSCDEFGSNATSEALPRDATSEALPFHTLEALPRRVIELEAVPHLAFKSKVLRSLFEWPGVLLSALRATLGLGIISSSLFAMPLRVSTHFSGAGTLETALGMLRAGASALGQHILLQCLLACDSNPRCREILAEHDIVVLADILERLEI